MLISPGQPAHLSVFYFLSSLNGFRHQSIYLFCCQFCFNIHNCFPQWNIMLVLEILVTFIVNIINWICFESLNKWSCVLKNKFILFRFVYLSSLVLQLRMWWLCMYSKNPRYSPHSKTMGWRTSCYTHYWSKMWVKLVYLLVTLYSTVCM